MIYISSSMPARDTQSDYVLKNNTKTNKEMEAQKALAIYLKSSSRLSQKLNLDLSGNKCLLYNDLSLSYLGFDIGSL